MKKFGLLILICLLVLPFSLTLAEDQINISASIAPKPTDLELSYSVSPPENSLYYQANEEITITISYRSLIEGSQPLNLSLNYLLGRINDSSTNLVNAISYISLSATTSPEGAVPVIDLVNRTVSWQINSLIGSPTSSGISLKLKVLENLSNEQIYNDLVLSAVFGSITLPNQEQNVELFSPLIIPTPTPTALPTPTSNPKPTSAAKTTTTTSTPTLTPTATPTSRLLINQIFFKKITNDAATIVAQTNVPSQYTLYYGQQSNNLNEREVYNQGHVQQHQIFLKNLQPQQQYFFRFLLIGENNTSVWSDIYTFTTAKQQKQFFVAKKDLSIVWQQIPLAKNNQQPVIVNTGSVNTVNLEVNNPQLVREIVMKYVNQQVLGIFSTQVEAAEKQVKMIEILPGTYSASLHTPPVPGYYRLVLSIKDIYNGLYTQTLENPIYVSSPLTVIENHTQKPIEKARVKIYRYMAKNKVYELLDQAYLQNLYTNHRGELYINLPLGYYQFDISAAGYMPHNRFVYRLDSTTKTYPQIKLTKSKNIFDRLYYYQDTLLDLANYSWEINMNIANSYRALTTVLRFAQIISFFLGFGLLFRRTGHNPIYYINNWLWQFKQQSKRLQVLVNQKLNRNNRHILIYIFNKQGKEIYKNTTNWLGEIIISKEKFKSIDFPIKITLHKRHFLTVPIEIGYQEWQTKQTITAEIKPKQYKINPWLSLWQFWEEFLVRFGSNLFVFLNLGITLVLILNQGWLKNLSFLITTLALFIFWFIYNYQQHLEEARSIK